jgi:hypothetical protein
MADLYVQELRYTWWRGACPLLGCGYTKDHGAVRARGRRVRDADAGVSDLHTDVWFSGYVVVSVAAVAVQSS